MKTLTLLSTAALLIGTSLADAQVITTYRPTVTYYAAPAVAPVAIPATAYYAPQATTTYYAPAPTTAYYAPAPATTAYYAAPAATPVTAYYAPAAVAPATAVVPVTTYYAPQPALVYDPTRILPWRRYRWAY